MRVDFDPSRLVVVTHMESHGMMKLAEVRTNEQPQSILDETMRQEVGVWDQRAWGQILRGSSVKEFNSNTFLFVSFFPFIHKVKCILHGSEVA